MFKNEGVRHSSLHVALALCLSMALDATGSGTLSKSPRSPIQPTGVCQGPTLKIVSVLSKLTTANTFVASELERSHLPRPLGRKNNKVFSHTCYNIGRKHYKDHKVRKEDIYKISPKFSAQHYRRFRHVFPEEQFKFSYAFC